MIEYHSKSIKKGAREKPVIKEPIESPNSVSFKTKAKRDQVETYAWKNIGEVFAKKNKNESNSTKQSKDSETLFSEMITQELKERSKEGYPSSSNPKCNI